MRFSLLPLEIMAGIKFQLEGQVVISPTKQETSSAGLKRFGGCWRTKMGSGRAFRMLFVEGQTRWVASERSQ